jgi:hypothetical protein
MWLPLLLACQGGAEGVAPSLPVAASRTTFASVTELGAHHMHAEVHRTVSGGTTAPQVSEETVDLLWRDPDHWSLTQARDGRVRSKVVVFDAVAWSADGDGALARRGDAEPYREQLAGTWDPWAFALESLADSISFTLIGNEVVDGRRTQRHTLGLLPPPAKPRHGWIPSSAEGDVWIDEATAVRLKGVVHVIASSGLQSLEVGLTFALDGLGVDPGVSAPDGDKR